MENYVLMHKNLAVSVFSIRNNEVVSWVLPKDQKALNHLPLPLKRIVHFIHGGYIEKESDKTVAINEEGTYYLEQWLHDRAIPITRENYTKYVTSSSMDLMIKNHSLSLTDCYWTRGYSENIKWDDIKLFGSPKIDRLNIIDEQQRSGKQYSPVNSTLGGQLEKFWYYVVNKDGYKQLKLAKKTSKTNNILNIREVIASKIYEKLGYRNYCDYAYIRNRSGDIVGCKCNAFTSESLELITAYDLLEEYGRTQSGTIYDDIINLAGNYGANKVAVRTQLDIQTLVDYLITNRDRHQNNIGFLRNSDTLEIVSIAPIFDSGSCAALEDQAPLGVTNTSVHNLYNTEMECLQHVSNINILDLNRLPEKRWIKNQLMEMYNANEYSVQKYLGLYLDKIDYIRKLQTN